MYLLILQHQLYVNNAVQYIANKWSTHGSGRRLCRLDGKSLCNVRCEKGFTLINGTVQTVDYTYNAPVTRLVR